MISKTMISDVYDITVFDYTHNRIWSFITVTHFKCSKECGFFGLDKRPGIHPFDRWNILSILKFNRWRNWPNSSRSSFLTCWCSDTIILQEDMSLDYLTRYWPIESDITYELGKRRTLQINSAPSTFGPSFLFWWWWKKKFAVLKYNFLLCKFNCHIFWHLFFFHPHSIKNLWKI